MSGKSVTFVRGDKRATLTGEAVTILAGMGLLAHNPRSEGFFKACETLAAKLNPEIAALVKQYNEAVKADGEIVTAETDALGQEVYSKVRDFVNGEYLPAFEKSRKDSDMLIAWQGGSRTVSVNLLISALKFAFESGIKDEGMKPVTKKAERPALTIADLI